MKKMVQTEVMKEAEAVIEYCRSRVEEAQNDIHKAYTLQDLEIIDKETRERIVAYYDERKQYWVSLTEGAISARDEALRAENFNRKWIELMVHQRPLSEKASDAAHEAYRRYVLHITTA